MSIYCTLWQIQVEDERPRLPGWYPESSRWIEVCAQAVPAFIAHPSVYPDGDPYAEILPWPVVVAEDPEHEPDSRPWGGGRPAGRAVRVRPALQTTVVRSWWKA